MSSKKGPYIVEYTLIIRNSEGQHITGTPSQGDLAYAKRLAQSALRIDLTKTYASVDIYRYCPTPWQELQPLDTVTLDDESEGGTRCS